MIPVISEFFLVSLALGISLFSPLANSKLTGAGFLKVLHSICLGSLVISTIIHFVYSGITYLWVYSVASLCLTLAIALHRDKKSLLMWVLWFIQNASCSYLLARISGGTYLDILFGFSSMLLLGSITYAMILGHWYLVVPRLTESPLKKAMVLMWAILLIKIIVALTIFFSDAKFLQMGTTLGSGYSFNWMLVLMRMLWGYLVIGIMSYYSWRLISMRSIQSATGVLYVMTFFVFIGELISTYLFYQHGVYL